MERRRSMMENLQDPLLMKILLEKGQLHTKGHNDCNLELRPPHLSNTILMTCYSFLTILSKYLSRPRADNYDPEAILIGSIQKEKSMEHSGKQNTSDPRRRESADRYRHRSSFSDRYNHP